MDVINRLNESVSICNNGKCDYGGEPGALNCIQFSKSIKLRGIYETPSNCFQLKCSIGFGIGKKRLPNRHTEMSAAKTKYVINVRRIISSELNSFESEKLIKPRPYAVFDMHFLND